MTKLLPKIACSIVFFSCIPILSVTYAQNKLDIAVIDLASNSISANDLAALSERLRSELFETARFSVMERSQMTEILKEQGMQQSGCTNTECAVRAGQLIGVRKVVLGSINRIESTYTLDIRLVDVETGKIEKVAKGDCENCSLNQILRLKLKEISHSLSDMPNTLNLRTTDNGLARTNSMRESYLVIDNSKEVSRMDSVEVTQKIETNRIEKRISPEMTQDSKRRSASKDTTLANSNAKKNQKLTAGLRVFQGIGSSIFLVSILVASIHSAVNQ